MLTAKQVSLKQFQLVKNISYWLFWEIILIWRFFQLLVFTSFNLAQKIVEFLAVNNHHLKKFIYILFSLSGVFLILVIYKLFLLLNDEKKYHLLYKFLQCEEQDVLNVVKYRYLMVHHLNIKFFNSSIYQLYQSNILIHLNLNH